MVPWHSTSRLVLDRDGDLWHWTDPGLHRLGPVESADVPEDLEGERAALLDAWDDRIDDRAEPLRGRR